MEQNTIIGYNYQRYEEKRDEAEGTILMKSTETHSGSGGMFVQSAKFIQAHSGNRGEIAVYGQESNADTWKTAMMCLFIFLPFRMKDSRR